jgi:hypothetical protein
VSDFIAGVGRALRGHGFDTAESIFRKVERGEVGARDTGEPNAVQQREIDTARGEPKFSLREDQSSSEAGTARSVVENEHQPAIDKAWDGVIAAHAKSLGWDGEPSSDAMALKALRTPKGAARTDLWRKAGLIKALEDQRASPFNKPPTSIKGDGETKVRGASQGSADMAAKRGGRTAEDLPTYDASKQEPLMERAREFVSNDTNREQAEAIAMGTEPAPYGQNAVSIRIALEERAAKEDDFSLINRIATKSKLNEEATTSGQNNAMYAQRDPHSPAAAIQEVQAARAAVAKVRASKSGGPAPDKAAKSAIKDMLAAMQKEAKQEKRGQTDEEKAAAKKQKWKTFVDGITCK